LIALSHFHLELLLKKNQDIPIAGTVASKSHAWHIKRSARKKMSATNQRDEVEKLAKVNPGDALNKALEIHDPWFRAQALSLVARFTDADPSTIAADAGRAAMECDDDYKRSAVRAWEISALAERGLILQARQVLDEAVALAQTVTPQSSRSEALHLLVQAAFRITRDDAQRAYQVLATSCVADEHWRCKRAIRDGKAMLEGKSQPRQFYW
jgi:hypothetical protein